MLCCYEVILPLSQALTGHLIQKWVPQFKHFVQQMLKTETEMLHTSSKPGFSFKYRKAAQVVQNNQKQQQASELFNLAE